MIIVDIKYHKIGTCNYYVYYYDDKYNLYHVNIASMSYFY